MTYVKKYGEKFTCHVCGNVVQVVHVGGGQLMCCDQYMESETEAKLKKEEQQE
jgi:desulfoferrodoxin-like iron-binding protein